ncbi:MAG: hypothetical protein MN733_09865 [Nitrososphaera sp.]|nr:hypothetical protein [Nitrososphaera sp.]
MNTKRVLQFIIALTISYIIPVNAYADEKWKIEDIKKKFKSCKEAVDFINSRWQTNYQPTI